MIATIQLLLVIVVSPLLLGVINRTKAMVAGRTGPPLLQAYYDIAKLLQKNSVISPTTTWMFLLGPAVALTVPILASLMLPIVGSEAPVSFAGDMILFVYLFALARFCTTAAALDTGSAFEGMGAAREMGFAALAEPALFFGFLALARVSGHPSLSSFMTLEGNDWRKASAALVLVVASWFIVLLAENSRVPFDDPTTHLELTMIHEVMVLDHGGPMFGMILWGTAMKLFVFNTLIAGVILPATGSRAVDLPVLLAAVFLIGIIIGLVESSMARLRLVRIPQLLVTASLIAGFAVVLVLR